MMVNIHLIVSLYVYNRIAYILFIFLPILLHFELKKKIPSLQCHPHKAKAKAKKKTSSTTTINNQQKKTNLYKQNNFFPFLLFTFLSCLFVSFVKCITRTRVLLLLLLFKYGLIKEKN